MEEFKNNFSWSITRDKTFKECKRKYYYNHYGYWGAWNPDAEQLTKELWALRSLKTKGLWIGDATHKVIENLLNNLKFGNLTPFSDSKKQLYSNLNTDFFNSKKGLHRVRPNKICGLFEHEYELEIDEKKFKELCEYAEKCLLNFYNSDTFKLIKNSNKSNWLPIEKLQNLNLSGTTIWLKIDFAIKDGNKVTIFDWKTGKIRADENQIQLGCYSYYAKQKWNLQPEGIITKSFNLYLDKLDNFKVSNESMNQFEKYASSSIKEMKDFLIEESTNTAKEKDFPKEPQEGKCLWCNFKKICQKNIVKN